MEIIAQQISKSLDKKQIKKMIDQYLITKPNLRIVGGRTANDT